MTARLDGLRRGACHRSRIRATRWRAMTGYPRKLQLRQLRDCYACVHDLRCRCAGNAVQKWHTSSCRISLRPANCLAKINHASWRGCIVGGFTHVPIIAHVGFCCPVLRGRRGQRPVIPRLPRTSMCVRDRPIGNRLTQNPVTDIGSPLMRRRAQHIVHRHRSMASTDRPTPRSRSMSNAHPPIRSVTTLRSGTTRRNATMRRGRLCPCPTVRGRDASSTTAMAAGGPPAIKPPLRWQCT